MTENYKEIHYIDLELDEFNSSLDYYENLLSRFNTFKEFKREVAIQSILNEKKIQFDIDDIKGELMGTLGKNNDVLLSIKNISFHIESMSFILKDSKILNLKVGLRIMETDKGRLLKKIVDNNLSIKLKTHKCNFYIDDLI